MIRLHALQASSPSKVVNLQLKGAWMSPSFEQLEQFGFLFGRQPTNNIPTAPSSVTGRYRTFKVKLGSGPAVVRSGQLV